jgi:hypothetical protein
MNRQQRFTLAQKRLGNVLRSHTVATDRTLEQKISDAGPLNQRIEPFILTKARGAMLADGRIRAEKRAKTLWYYMAEAEQDEVQLRLGELEPIYGATQEGEFKIRVGQALEIAVERALKESGRDYLGTHSDLGEHDDSTLYKKVEPPLIVSGQRMRKGPLDYIVFEPWGKAGIEVKNYRTWLYSRSSEVKDMLMKCSDVGAVPVLIARRVPFITFRLLNLSGCLVHQTYNQRYPKADEQLAELVRDKRMLGYHDVRTGNEPDDRMRRFVCQLLPELVEKAKPVFETFSSVHANYGNGKITYDEWVKEILVRNGIWAEQRGEPPEGWEPGM